MFMVFMLVTLVVAVVVDSCCICWVLGGQVCWL